jgi:protein-tyrosine phosphatase
MSGEPTSVAARPIGLAGEPGARDLGGLPAADGRRVRPGRLLRAASLGRLTDADVALLHDLGVGLVIDLRDGSEIAAAPPDRLPPGARSLALPVFDPRHPLFGYVAGLLAGRDPQVPREILVDGPEAAMTGIYRWFVTADLARSRFAAAVRAVAGADGPVLFHCSAGKDRTGWLAAVLLHALGVPREVAAADYRATTVRGPGPAGSLETAWSRRHGTDPALLEPLLAARPGYLEAAYGQADLSFGGMDGYLSEGLGLDGGVCGELRGRLLV